MHTVVTINFSEHEAIQNNITPLGNLFCSKCTNVPVVCKRFMLSAYYYYTYYTYDRERTSSAYDIIITAQIKTFAETGRSQSELVFARGAGRQ